jgi:hypothetical protein
MKENLKNLPPEERIKRLKKLEEKKKKEIEEAKKEIKESQDELTERKKWQDKVPIPQVAIHDLKNLTDDEKMIVEAHRGKTKKQENIEEVIEEEKKEQLLEELAQEKVDLPPELMQSDYTQQLSHKPMGDIYSEMTQINKAAEEKGYVSAEEERRVEYLSSAVERKIEDVESGKYSLTEEVAMAVSVTRQIGSKLRDVYKSEPRTDYQS